MYVIFNRTSGNLSTSETLEAEQNPESQSDDGNDSDGSLESAHNLSQGTQDTDREESLSSARASSLSGVKHPKTVLAKDEVGREHGKIHERTFHSSNPACYLS